MAIPQFHFGGVWGGDIWDAINNFDNLYVTKVEMYALILRLCVKTYTGLEFQFLGQLGLSPF